MEWFLTSHIRKAKCNFTDIKLLTYQREFSPKENAEFVALFSPQPSLKNSFMILLFSWNHSRVVNKTSLASWMTRNSWPHCPSTTVFPDLPLDLLLTTDLRGSPRLDQNNWTVELNLNHRSKVYLNNKWSLFQSIDFCATLLHSGCNLFIIYNVFKEKKKKTL